MLRSLSLTQQSTILSLLDVGQSGETIARQTGVSPSAISKLHSKEHSILSKAIGGHPPKLSPTNIHYAQHLITSGKAENAVQVTKPLSNIINQPFSANTVHLHLKKAGIKAVVKSKHPLLSARYHKAHMDFACTHKNWTIEVWKKVIWSDETKINCVWSDGHKWAWKRAGEGLSDGLVDGTLKFEGGSLMMWGCMTWKGVGFATKIDSRMDGNFYLQILKDELQQTLEYYGLNPPNTIFQQDNDPKHTCRMVKNWLEKQEFRTMVWPAQSPDLNPIEHLWGCLKRRLTEHENPSNGIYELWERVQVKWDRILVEECQKLIESMPRRVQAVLKAKGGYIKY